MLWELATREEVYASLTAAQVLARVADEGLRPPVPRGCPWAAVMQACWHEDPAARPAFDLVLSSLVAIQRDLFGGSGGAFLPPTFSPPKPPAPSPVAVISEQRSRSHPPRQGMVSVEMTQPRTSKDSEPLLRPSAGYGATTGTMN